MNYLFRYKETTDITENITTKKFGACLQCIFIVYRKPEKPQGRHTHFGSKASETKTRLDARVARRKVRKTGYVGKKHINTRVVRYCVCGI